MGRCSDPSQIALRAHLIAALLKLGVAPLELLPGLEEADNEDQCKQQDGDLEVVDVLRASAECPMNARTLEPHMVSTSMFSPLPPAVRCTWLSPKAVAALSPREPPVEDRREADAVESVSSSEVEDDFWEYVEMDTDMGKCFLGGSDSDSGD